MRRKVGEVKVNARKALKAASKRIEDLEYYNRRASQDIKAYNKCIDHMIAGGSPCDYCEDQEECQLQAKTAGKGCDMWMLMDINEEVPDESKGLLHTDSPV